MRAVVLAAGLGQRLSGSGPSLPKPLVSLAGKPLVSHTLHALAEAGLKQALVVTGYGESAVRKGALEGSNLPVEFAANPLFQKGASYSLLAARSWCGDEPFLLVMCDHAFSSGLIQELLKSVAAYPLGRTCRVAADSSARPAAYVDEATKLSIASTGSVTAIGKELSDWDALDAGAFICSPVVWEAVAAAPEDCSLSVIMAVLARDGCLGTVDVSGHFWYDIDTATDLQEAERLLAARVSSVTKRA